MKKETKLSWAERIKKRNKMGFSLVELIVVIAIMAIMTAVLAPSLLAYVERSRAQKDDSAMSEVVNSIQLALADQSVYDEVLCYTCDNIKSCYVDKANPDEDNIVETKNYGSTPNSYEEGDHFIYNNNERLSDESGYIFAGLMRGVTITFEPERSSNKTAFVLYNGYINAAGHATGTGLNYLYGSCPETETTSADMVTAGYTDDMMLLGNMHSFSAPNHNYLYNRIRSTVGDRIELSSQTYRNSCYTVFIRMGTTGGNQADKQDAIMVYGQWSGTNLSASQKGQGAGASNTPGVELPEKKATLNDYSWAEIKAIAQSDADLASYNIVIGDKDKGYKEENGVKYYLVDDARNESYGGLVFMFKYVDPQTGSSTAKMNNTNTNAGGYKNSAMPAFLTNTVMPTLSDGLKGAIKNVDIMYNDGCYDADGTTGSDRVAQKMEDVQLFLPSVREVGFATTGYAWYADYEGGLDGEGTVFEYFDANKIPDGTTVEQRRQAISSSDWWLRSAGGNYNDLFWNVLSFGTLSNDIAGISHVVAPAFVVG